MSTAPALLPALSLYSLPIASPTAIICHAVGSFSAINQSEVITATAAGLTLYRLDVTTGELSLILHQTLFTEILSIKPFRFIGSPSIDRLIVTSDSGYVSIIEYLETSNQFSIVQSMMIGKTGMRRQVPGLYIAVDPQGRALMLGSVEKTKLAFMLQSDHSTQSKDQSRPSIKLSSPLEANKSNVMTLALTAVDVGLDNPMFAAIEIDYNQEDRSGNQSSTQIIKHLVYYEIDLGLNHVTRKHSQQIDSLAHGLLTVPGGDDGPGGVLILCENHVLYQPYSFDQSINQLKCWFPRRHGIDINPTLLTIASTSHHQAKLFFFILQSEHGDLYKVSFDQSNQSANGTSSSNHSVNQITVSYFDSIAPSTGISLLKRGFLFSASEAADHYLFQLLSLGDDDGSEDYVANQSINPSTNQSNGEDDINYFHTRNSHKNLSLVYTLEGRHPITDMKIIDPASVMQLPASTHNQFLINESSPIIYTLTGTGRRSMLRYMMHGLAVTELAMTELNAHATNIFAVKGPVSDTSSNSLDDQSANQYHSYICLSFASSTVVLSVGETVTEVADSGLLTTVSSILIDSLVDGSLIQVHSNGIRHVRPDKRVVEWRPDSTNQSVLFASCNERNLLIGLSGGQFVYFEQDRTGKLIDVYRKDLMSEIVALALAPIDTSLDSLRGRFIAIASADQAVRVFSTDPDTPMNQLSTFTVNAAVSSLLIQSRSNNQPNNPSVEWFMYIGLVTGIMTRSRFSVANAALTDHRRRFLGPRPIMFHRCMYRGQSAVLALADRVFMDTSINPNQSKLGLAQSLLPLAYDSLECAAAFSSRECPEGIVAIVGSTLRILTLPQTNGGDPFHSTNVRLRFTPRKLAVIPSSQFVAVLETDHNSYSRSERTELEAIVQAAAKEGGMTDDQPNKELDEEQQAFVDTFIGSPYAGEGKWASCLSLHCPPFVAPPASPTIIDFDDNEAAFSMTMCNFDPAFNYAAGCVCVGTVKDLRMKPRSFTSGAIHVFAVDQTNGRSLKLVHRTPVNEVPLAMVEFQLRLLVGVGTSIRMFEMGKRRLLLKTEFTSFRSPVNYLHVIPGMDRVVVGTMTDGFVFLQYSAATKSFNKLSDSPLPRFMSSACSLDVDTVAGADKFSNVFVCRLPEMLTAEKTRSLDRVPGSTQQLLDIASFHCDSIVTAMGLVQFHPGVTATTSSWLCATLSGGLIAFMPITARDEIEFLNHFELHVRAAYSTSGLALTRRDHLAFRSAYLPVKSVVDGSLLNQFAWLPRDKQISIADEMQSTPEQIIKRLEEIRTRIL